MEAKNNTFERLVSDVCSIFQEVTGAEANPKREASAIMHWNREQKWETFDFRLIIEFCFSNVKEKEFFSQPGRMNIRSMFNPARGDILLDIHSDLKRSKEIQKHHQQPNSIHPDIKINRIRLKCGTIFLQKFLKIPDSTVIPGGYRWKQSEDNLKTYENHHTRCIENHGQCMWPTWKLLEMGIQPGWREEHEIY